MRCFFCGKNKKTTTNERRDFDAFGYYTPSWYVMQDRISEDQLEEFNIDPDDDAHFLCWDCLHEIEKDSPFKYSEKKSDFLMPSYQQMKMIREASRARKNLNSEILSLLKEKYINPDEKYIQKIINAIYLFSKGFVPSPSIKESVEDCRENILRALDRNRDYKNYSLLSRKNYLISTITLYWGTSQREEKAFPLNQFNKEFSSHINSKLLSKKIRFEVEGARGSLIGGTEYLPFEGLTTFKVGINTFLYLYLGLDRDIFFDDFIVYYTHENTHAQQDQLNFHKQPIKTIQGSNPSKVQLNDYFSQKSEIDAYARMVACYVNEAIYHLRKELTYQEIEDMLSQGNVRNILSRGVKEGIIEEVALQIYDWYKKLPSKVFKRFLKKVMDYFDDQSKGKYDYKNWFLSKKPLNVVEERQKNLNQLLGV